MEKLSLIISGIVIVAAGLFFFNYDAISAKLVYMTCETSRTTNLVSEEQCANAQYFSKYEFLCTMRNSSVINHCWTEKNDQLEQY